MHHFSVAETAITETLLSLDLVKTNKGAIHLVGQKQDALAKAIGTGGPLSDKGKSAAKALDTFRSHDAFRVQLVHGLARIAVERSGKWLIVLRHRVIRSGDSNEQTMVVEQEEADALLKQLQRDSGALCSTLSNLRKAALA